MTFHLLLAAIRSMRWQNRAGARFIPADLAAAHHTIVKSNPFRSVFHVQSSNVDVHVKHCHPTGIRAWLRECLRPAKAVLEFRNLCRLRDRKIPTLEPIAAGAARRYGPGSSVLITQTVSAATTLAQYLEVSFPRLPRTEQTRSRQALARAIGSFLAQLCRAGVRHRDLHPGNLLLTWHDGSPQLLLMDVHNIRISSPGGDVEPLVLLNRWFALRATRTDRLRCWREYRRNLDRDARRAATDPREIELATSKSNRRLWQSCFGRSCADNRRFRRFAFGAMRGFAVRDLNLADLRAIIECPTKAMRDAGELLKDSRSSTVARLTVRINGEQRALILKRFRAKTRWHGLRSLFRTTACMRSWQNGHSFRDALLPTPRPLAIWQVYRRGLPADGYLLQELADGIDLHSYLRRLLVLSNSNITELIETLARFVRTLHERGWSHRDLKASNLLVSWSERGPRITLVDLVGGTRSSSVSASRRQRDLARLNASFCNAPAFSRTDRLRFLRTYMNWHLCGKRDWKRWWRQVARFTRAKVEQNLRRGRVLK